jgi:hypothetical protein
MSPAFQPALSYPKSPKLALSLPGATAGPPSQRTWQMEKNIVQEIARGRSFGEEIRKEIKTPPCLL